MNEQKLPRLAIILGTLLMSGLLGMKLIYPGSRERLLLVPIGAVLLGFAVWLLHRQELGPLLLIAAAFIVPLQLGTGTETTINAAILFLAFLVGIWLVDRIILKRGQLIFWSRPTKVMLGLCLAATVSLLIGQLDWFVFVGHASMKSQLGGLGLFYLSALAFILPSQVFTDLRWLKRMTWLFILLGGLFALSTILPRVGFIGRFFNNGAGGSLFWIWVIVLPLSQGLINTELKMIQRLLLVGMAAAIWVGRFMQYRAWVSGWLPQIAAILVVLVLAGSWIGFTTSAAAAAIGVKYINRFLANLNVTSTGGEDYSFLTRLEALKAMQQIIRVNPITGFGPANYYFYTPLTPLRGFYIQFNSHNQYMDLLAQVGVIGLGLFLWLSVEIARMGWKLSKLLPDGFGRAYALGALGGLAGMLVSGMLGDWVIPFVYNIGLNGFQSSVFGWLFLGGLVSLERFSDTTKS